MKILTALLFVIVSAAVVKGIDNEEKRKMMMATVNSCKASTGASEDDIMKFMAREKPQTKEIMCLYNCFMETVGVTKDGKLAKEGAMAWGKSMGAPDDLLGKLIAECENEIGADVCEGGAKVGLCLMQNAAKYKLDC